MEGRLESRDSHHVILKSDELLKMASQNGAAYQTPRIRSSSVFLFFLSQISSINRVIRTCAGSCLRRDVIDHVDLVDKFCCVAEHPTPWLEMKDSSVAERAVDETFPALNTR